MKRLGAAAFAQDMLALPSLTAGRVPAARAKRTLGSKALTGCRVTSAIFGSSTSSSTASPSGFGQARHMSRFWRPGASARKGARCCCTLWRDRRRAPRRFGPFQDMRGHGLGDLLLVVSDGVSRSTP
jgi:hypothetical protein